MTRPAPVTKADYDRVAELHAQGISGNAIATETGRSGRTISRIAAELVLSADRARTRPLLRRRSQTLARSAPAWPMRSSTTPPVCSCTLTEELLRGSD